MSIISNEVYKNFANVGLDGKTTFCLNCYVGKIMLKVAETLQEGEKELSESTSATHYAQACETALKTLLFYTEFIKMACFTNTSGKIIVGTYVDKSNKTQKSWFPVMGSREWRLLLDGEKEGLSPQYTDPRFGIISKPILLLQEIQKNALTGDIRKDTGYMEKDSIHSYNLKKSISGHDLYAYLRLQAPEIQVLINNCLFLQGERTNMKDKILAIMKGYVSTEITSNQSSIYKNSRVFEKKRFDWITNQKMPKDQLLELINFTNALREILDFKFPNKELLLEIHNRNYSKYDNNPDGTESIFSTFDPVGKYYLSKYFTQEEVDNLKKIIDNNGLNISDSISFVNMCIYYKYYIREKLKLDNPLLDFNLDFVQNLLNHTLTMKLYDANNVKCRLEDDTSFIDNMSKILSYDLTMCSGEIPYYSNMNNYDISWIKEALSYSLGSDIHESWRQLRRNDDGTYEPRIKKSKDEAWNESHGTDEVDIANCTFDQLPSNWQYENLEAAKVVIDLIYDKTINGLGFSEQEIDEIGTEIHRTWLERNPYISDPDDKGYNPQLAVSYEKLPVYEKHKCLTQIKAAQEKIIAFASGKLNLESICNQYGIQSSSKTL